MFRRTPPPHQPAPAAPDPASADKAHGFLYWADQRALVFGADRREPRSHRLALALTRSPEFTALLPSTTRVHPSFFHLAPDQCLFIQATDPRHSYPCPRYETVPNTRLRTAGLVTQAARVQVWRWLHDPDSTP